MKIKLLSDLHMEFYDTVEEAKSFINNLDTRASMLLFSRETSPRFRLGWERFLITSVSGSPTSSTLRETMSTTAVTVKQCEVYLGRFSKSCATSTG